MFDSQTIDVKKIKKIAEDLLRKIAPEAEVGVLPQKDLTITVEVKVDDPQALIGQGSETLLAAQHLLRVIVRKATGESCYIDLDINGYKKKRKEFLKELALSAANDVALAKREVSLVPMSAYERRIIHMELSERRDIVTESQGSGPARKVVIRPAS